jgi:hypothetical protein
VSLISLRSHLTRAQCGISQRCAGAGEAELSRGSGTRYYFALMLRVIGTFSTSLREMIMPLIISANF